MSLSIDFEPHSWYKEFALKKRTTDIPASYWRAYTANGMTGYIVELEAPTLKELKQLITDYHKRNAERDAYNRKMIGEK